MENNNDLLERIRRSQQPAQLNEQFEVNGSNQVYGDNIPSQEESEKESDGFFQKSSFPVPSFWALIFSLVTTFLIFGVSSNIIEPHFYEIGEYFVAVIIIMGVIYWKACLNKWVEKKGATMFSKIVRFLLNLQILLVFILAAIDAYKWYKLG